MARAIKYAQEGRISHAVQALEAAELAPDFERSDRAAPSSVYAERLRK